MGRWGMRLFEGDQDLDMACELSEGFVKDKEDEVSLSCMLHQTDMIAPPEARLYYETEEYKPELEDLVTACRDKLDTGLGAKLFHMWRSREHEYNGQYRTIIFGALMMRAGARIRDSDMQHLRDLIPKIPSRPGFSLAFADDGFRNPGKAQLLAAMDSYQAGTPRSFGDPSCYKCGKMQVDTGKALKKCAACHRVWYCDQTCQKKHWHYHKASCHMAQHSNMLNV